MDNGFYDFLSKTTGETNILIDEPMKLHTSFKIGGPAKYFVTPSNTHNLCQIVELCRSSRTDYIILGNGSNVLVSDSGYDGVVIQIQKNLCDISVTGRSVYAQAGALLSKISGVVAKKGLAGFEFASGIPGTFGGAIRMNAGAYGAEIKDVLESAEVYIPGRGIERIENRDMCFAYRTSAVSRSEWIVLGGTLKLENGNKEEIAARIEELKINRNTKQPLDVPSAGSAFKRPNGSFAGKLIMDAGLKGVSVGDAAVSEKHCGFLINTGNATASDMKKLFDLVIDTVWKKFNVRLEPEVKFIGRFEE